jgi:hypothetical protein
MFPSLNKEQNVYGGGGCCGMYVCVCDVYVCSSVRGVGGGHVVFGCVWGGLCSKLPFGSVINQKINK